VEDTVILITPEQNDMSNSDNMGFKTRESENIIWKMMLAVRYSLSDLASSNNEEDVEDEDDEDIELAKLS
jgi:hypothetical protein